jgi:signal transduction histidine kinase
MQSGLTKAQLRRWLSLFLLLLIGLTTLLGYQALSQMKWETFRQHQVLAEELADRIDNHLSALIEREEQRSLTEYNFLNVLGDVKSNFIQRSPLSSFPVKAEIPGLIGYFQVDHQGRFSSPLLPVGSPKEAYGLPKSDYAARLKLQQQIQQLLSQNELVKAAKKEPIAKADQRILEEIDAPMVSLTEAENDYREDNFSKKSFDRLERAIPSKREQAASSPSAVLGQVAELKLTSQFQDKQLMAPQEEKANLKAALTKRKKRKEQAVVAASLAVADEAVRVTTFESEIDPFYFAQLNSGHFVLFRKVWRNGQRTTQGILFEQQAFLNGVIEQLFKSTALAEMSDLIVAFQGNLLAHFSGTAERYQLSSASELSGELLYQTNLSAPLAKMQLIFSIRQLPAGSGAPFIYWVLSLLLLLLCGGFYLIYRLGLKQLQLAQQQQDFVSAVSHELKTPLTSIRMYGEILREGWADEEKKSSYYDYIFHESERLTRLINNVLQLARMRHNELHLDLKKVTIDELIDLIQSKASSPIERSGFQLQLSHEEGCDGTLIVDPDAFTQIMLNLVDNAVKFSAKAEIKQIDITCRRLSDNQLAFTVRDYGPGISKGQKKKIFQLFYRSENELTRSTVGTGIGLALVKQLAQQMGATVDAIEKRPGVEFRLVFSG